MNCRFLRGRMFVLFLAATAVACQTAGYRVVDRQPVEGAYSILKFSFRMEGYDNQNCTAAIHTKLYDESGFLGVCGFVLSVGENYCGDGLLGRKLTDALFENATLLLGKTVISKAGFYTLRDFGTTAADAVPTCVRTEKAWRENYTYLSPRIKFSGYNEVTE